MEKKAGFHVFFGDKKREIVHFRRLLSLLEEDSIQKNHACAWLQE